MRDSTAELQITLCWFPPVAGLKGVKLRPSVSDLAAGFSIAPSWYGQRCPPRGGDIAQVAPARSAVQGVGREVFPEDRAGRYDALPRFPSRALDTFPPDVETIPGMSCCCSNRRV